MTLSFLGELPEAAPVEKALESCQCGEIELAVAGLDILPNARHPTVLYAGITGATDSLMHLQTAIAAALAEFVEPERRPFLPHLTLARVRQRSHSHFVTSIPSLSAIWGSPPEPWRVTGFSLMQSHLGDTGARHSVVRVFGTPKRY